LRSCTKKWLNVKTGSVKTSFSGRLTFACCCRVLKRSSWRLTSAGDSMARWAVLLRDACSFRYSIGPCYVVAQLPGRGSHRYSGSGGCLLRHPAGGGGRSDPTGFSCVQQITFVNLMSNFLLALCTSNPIPETGVFFARFLLTSGYPGLMF